jgi:hypothetical protein
MSRWLRKVLTRVHELAAEGKVRLTAKANRELSSLALGLDPEDVRDVLLGLTVGDSAGRRVSKRTGEWMYVFKPHLGGEIVYMKLILRGECVIVSFHEDEGGTHEEAE